MSKLFVAALKAYLTLVLLFMFAAFCLWIANPNRKVTALAITLADCFQYPFWIFTSKGRSQLKKSITNKG